MGCSDPKRLTRKGSGQGDNKNDARKQLDESEKVEMICSKQVRKDERKGFLTGRQRNDSFRVGSMRH
eukprot:gene8226-5748_t